MRATLLPGKTTFPAKSLLYQKIAVFWLFITWLVPTQAQAQWGGVSQPEYEALVDFYNATGGDNWTHKDNWLTSEPVSTWYGMTMYNGGVIRMYLGDNHLVGTLPPELSNLTNLQDLRLNNNQLSGDINAVTNLTELQTLYLYDNQLSGGIPPAIGKLTKLQSLLLYKNPLRGIIPPALSGLTNLYDLRLNDAQLSGNIDAINTLTKLKVLYLHGNQLSGPIPPQVGAFAELYYVMLNNNQFSGSIPAGMETSTKLNRLYIYNNQFNSLPNFSNTSTLTDLRVGINQLTFQHIEPNIGKLPSTDRYSPQSEVGPAETVSVLTGNNLTLSANFSGASANNRYQWFKNGVAVTGVVASHTYTITNATSSNAGVYTCKITNTVVSGLVLTRRPVTVTVNPCTASSAYVYSPANGSVGAVFTMFYAGGANGANSYTIEVSKQVDFSGTTIVKTNSSNAIPFNELEFNQKYYVRVKTNLSPCWGRTTSFTTGSPESYYYIYNPADGAINASFTLYSAGPQRGNYVIQISTQADFAANTITKSNPHNGIVFPEMRFNQKYYARSRSEQDSQWGRTTSFTTGFPEVYCYIYSPANGATSAQTTFYSAGPPSATS